MPLYWEWNVGGIQVENFNMKEEDEHCENRNHKCKVKKMNIDGRSYGQHNIDF